MKYKGIYQNPNQIKGVGILVLKVNLRIVTSSFFNYILMQKKISILNEKKQWSSR